MVYREPNGLAILLAIFGSMLTNVQPGVIVSLALKKFDNKGRYAYEKSQTCGPFGSCNIYFKLCVKSSNYQPSDMTGCWYHINTRDQSRNAHSVDFKTVDTGIPKTLQIRRSYYPGSVGFYMEVWDRDWATNDDKLDVYSFWRRVSATVNGSRPVTRDEAIIGQRPNTPPSKLTFSLQVKCELYYFGPSCDKYCKGQNDAYKGHYTCDGSGRHVCLTGWFNPPSCLTYCVPKDDKANGHYTCDSNGTRICRPGWYAWPNCNRYCVPQTSDSNGHYSCSTNGTRVCIAGWAGELCDRRLSPTVSSIASTDGTRVPVFSGKVLLPTSFISFPPYYSSFLQRESSATTNIETDTTSLRKVSGLSLTRTETFCKQSSKSCGSPSANFDQTLIMSTSTLQTGVPTVGAILPASIVTSYSSIVTSYSSPSSVLASNLSKFTVASNPFTVLTDPMQSTLAVSPAPSSAFQLPHSASSVSTAEKQNPSQTTLTQRSFTHLHVSKINAISWSAHRNRDFSTKVIQSLHHSRTPKLASTFDGLRSSAYTETQGYTNVGQKSAYVGVLTVSAALSNSYITEINSHSLSVVHNSHSVSVIHSLSVVHNSTQPPKVNVENDADIFVWMINTKKGNLVFISFTLALVFFLAFVLAVCKIYRIKRSLVQPVSIKGVISPFDLDDENHINGKTDQSFQMCSTACFGIVRKGGPQYSYQRQATEI